MKNMTEIWGERIKRLEKRIEKLEKDSSKAQEKRNKGIKSRFNDREVYRLKRWIKAKEEGEER